MEQIKVGQLNLHHCREASALLCKRLAGGDLDLALIQEPWIHDGSIMGLKVKGYNLFYDTLCNRPRACIIAKSGLNAINLVNYLDGDLVAVSINHIVNGCRTDFVFVSAYLPYDGVDPLSVKAKAVLNLCGSKKKLVFGCDANAHHTVWGSSDCNKRGEDLMDYILFFNLYLLNRGNEPTFVTKNRREVIDLTICNSSSFDYIYDWRVSDAITASDHQLILFSIKGLIPVKAESRNPRFTNWCSYKKDLKKFLDAVPGKFNSVDDLEVAVDYVQQAILTSYHQNCKLTSTSSPRRVPWWSSELSSLRKKCRKLFNRAKKTGDWQTYRNALTTYSKAIRDAKKCSWQRFCDGIKDMSATAKVVKIMTRDTSCNLNAINLSDGSYCESGDEVLAEMLRVHFPGSHALTNDVAAHAASPCSKDNWEAAKQVVSQDKVIWAINSFKPYKSPGMDGIVPILLKEGIHLLVPILCRIFRSCIAYGYIPRSWRYAKVVFIPKVGKDNYFEAKSFRPISLTSFLLKTVEKLVDRHLRDSVLLLNPLSPSQHAYQPGRSTCSALYDLSFLLEKSICAKEIALATFLDIEGAFDRVPFDTIVKALVAKGTNPTIVRWIENLLSSRYVHASALGTSMVVHAMAGCPQGGVLSPTLWCCVVDSLLVLLASLGVYCLCYADDVVIVIRGKFGATVSGILNEVLRQVALWCTASGLSANPAKTSLVAFTNKKVLNLKDIFFCGVRLEHSTEVKFLGIYFDNHLNWGRHLTFCLQKAKRVFWCCRGSIGKTWGLTPKAVYWIYSMIICPIVTYGSIAWWSRTRLATVKTHLNKLQRMVCVALTGCIRTTPTATLELLLGLLPLDLRIEAEALTCMKRFKCLGYWKDYSKNLSWGLFNPQVVAHFSFIMPNDDILTRFAFYKPFNIHFPTKEQWLTNPKWMKGNHMVWYTDGSRLDGRAGAGVFCSSDDTRLSFPLGMFATVFQAEVFAILMCCKMCMSRGYRKKTIYICSDSQAALLALLKCSVNSSLVWECLTVLCDLAIWNQVSLYWVPGHVGIHGNECADELARIGSGAAFTGPEPVLGISSATIRDVVFNVFRRKQHYDWRNSVGQRQAKELNTDCPSLRQKELMKLHRNGLRKVIGLLTGHCTLRRHLSIMGVSDNPFCRGCHLEEETARHILCDCEVFSAHRFEHLGRHLIEPWELKDIPIRCLLNFASATGLFS